LAEFFLGRLLLAALLGDSLLELLEPLLEQTNLDGRVIGPCRDRLAGGESAQGHRRDGYLIVPLLSPDFHDLASLQIGFR
jgi:hypothetical protein